jgi:putative ABC transport system permease protein
MIRNYLKIAWRNLLKNKTFSFINIAGLSIGIAACLLVLQYVSFQLSFDQFNKNIDNLYRVSNDRYQNGKMIQHGTITYSAIGKTMQADFPEVADFTTLCPQGANIISAGNKKVGELKGIAADNSFLSMFSYQLVSGNIGTALEEAHSTVLTQSAARKIFDIKDDNYSAIVGKLLLIGTDSLPYKVTGILKDVPENSHLRFDLLTSYITLYTGPNAWKAAEYNYGSSDFWHYILLKPGANYKALEAKFTAFSQRHLQGTKITGSDEKFYLQPLSKAHLYSDFEYEIGITDSSIVVWGLLIVAVLIIIIAWINYINLSTSRSIERAKEVGIRKVAGATKTQLIRQFLTESLLINIIALLCGLLMVSLVQSRFNDLVHYKLSLSYIFQKSANGYAIPIILIASVAAGIFISGFYPAFILSSFKPILVLKGKFSGSGKGLFLRKSLVIGQFAITVILIIGSLVVYKQIKFVNEQKLGINLEQTLVVKPPQLTNWDSTFITKENAFKAEIKKIANVNGVANTSQLAGDELGRSFNIRREGASDDLHFTTRQMGVSSEFIDIYKIKLLAGRNFVETDYDPKWQNLHNTIINETAVKLLGFSSPQDAVGKIILSGTKKWDIVGVIGDFHQKSLRYPIEALRLMPTYGTYNPISVKVETKNLPATIADIKRQYDAFFPGNLFDYYFLDEKFNNQYSNDLLFGKVFSLFSGFAILIACLGLLGLSLFATIQRTKEIGVRKVLGASVSNIVMLLSKDFIKLVIIAFVVATPIAWYIMHKWLEGFAYRITMSWWIFILTGSLAVIIALATISFQAIKAAMANPVKSLRTE